MDAGCCEFDGGALPAFALAMFWYFRELNVTRKSLFGNSVM